MPATPDPRFHLLDASGRPDPAAMAAQVRRELSIWGPDGDAYVERRRPDTVAVVTHDANRQAARWGKSDLEIARLDLNEEIALLGYSSWGFNARERQDELRRKRDRIEAELAAAMATSLPGEFERAAA